MAEAIQNNLTPILAVGLSAVHKAHFIESTAASMSFTGKTIAVIAEDEQNAVKIADDINNMSGAEMALHFPAKEFSFRQMEGRSREYEYLRLGVLARLAERSCKVVVMSAEAALQLTIPATALTENSIVLCTGNPYSLDQIITGLVAAGYARRPQVDGIAQFSVRGGILDVYPPGESAPVRIEFWGDEIDSMAYFDLESQRRTDVTDYLKITPASEVLFPTLQALREKLADLQKKAANPDMQKTLQHDIEHLDGGAELSSLDKYISLAYSAPATIFDYFEDGIVFISEYSAMRENARAFLQQHSEDIKILLEEGEICSELGLYCTTLGALQSRWEQHPTVYLDTFARTNSEIRPKKLIHINAMQTSGWSGEIRLLKEDLQGL